LDDRGWLRRGKEGHREIRVEVERAQLPPVCPHIANVEFHDLVPPAPEERKEGKGGVLSTSRFRASRKGKKFAMFCREEEETKAPKPSLVP